MYATEMRKNQIWFISNSLQEFETRSEETNPLYSCQDHLLQQMQYIHYGKLGEQHVSRCIQQKGYDVQIKIEWVTCSLCQSKTWLHEIHQHPAWTGP